MLALRPLILGLVLMSVPLCVWALYPFDSPVKLVALFAVFFISATLTRKAIFEPLRALRFFQNFAQKHNFACHGSLSHDPLVNGAFEGRKFVAGISAHIARDSDERYRTIISSPVQQGVPSGLRIYSPETQTWSHPQSGRHVISTGYADLHEHLVCEGYEGHVVQSFVKRAQTRDTILSFFERYPDTLIHGGELQLPADPDGASGVVSVAFRGRVLDESQLLGAIHDVCAFAKSLEPERA